MHSEVEVFVIEAESRARWYVLHVRPNYEMFVSARLTELGVEKYVPVNKHSNQSGRNSFSAGLPLFPGYVFSLLDLHSGPRLYTIPGVIRILGYGGHATPIEEGEIEMIRSITRSPLPVELIPYFHPGNRISLKAGPLAGVAGTFLSSTKCGKLIVSLPLLHRSLAVTVLSEWVAADRSHTCLAEVRAS
jgi:transcription antitermination factor NusG